MGDGFVATFDSPGRAIGCALAIRDTLRALGIDVRAGVHTGEIEIRGEDVAGMAVHIGARVSALAGPGEVLVSGSVPPLVAGSGIEFGDRGAHELKGVPGDLAHFRRRGLTGVRGGPRRAIRRSGCGWCRCPRSRIPGPGRAAGSVAAAGRRRCRPGCR